MVFANGKLLTKAFSAVALVLLALCAYAPFVTCETAQAKSADWKARLAEFSADDEVNQALFVKYLGNSKAEINLYVKKTAESGKVTWKRKLKCKGYVGRNGINKKREGDGKTPTGTFNITSGYGIKKNPGTKLPYVKVNKYHYWCGDKKYYNQLVDVRKQKHDCNGEHLIEYTRSYAYGLFMDYNMNPVKYLRGSALFIHCFSGKKSTAGCVSMSKANMKKVLRALTPGAKICIYKK